MEESNIRSQRGSQYDKIPQKGKYMHTYVTIYSVCMNTSVAT